MYRVYSMMGSGMRELNYEAQEMLLFRRMPKGEMRGTNNRLEEIRWNMLHGRRTAGGRESRSEEALLNWGNPQGSCSAGEGSPSAIGPSMDGRTAGKGFGLPRLGTGSGVSWGVYWASGQPVPPIVRRRAPQIEARGPLDALGCFGALAVGLGAVSAHVQWVTPSSPCQLPSARPLQQVHGFSYGVGVWNKQKGVIVFFDNA